VARRGGAPAASGEGMAPADARVPPLPARSARLRLYRATVLPRIALFSPPLRAIMSVRVPLNNRSCLVVGGSRGIGKEFARQLLGKDCRVVATSRREPSRVTEVAPPSPRLALPHRGLCARGGPRIREGCGHATAPVPRARVDPAPARAPGPQLSDLRQGPGGDRLSVVQCDVASAESVDACCEGLRDAVEGGFDFVLVASGVRWMTPEGYGKEPALRDVAPGHMTDAFVTNALGPLLVAQGLVRHGLLRSPSLIANLSSKMGSIQDNGSGGAYPYRASKAALNAVTKSLAVDLAGDGVGCVVLHPGWVRTDMTGGNGLIDCDECVSGLIRVLEDTGSLARADPDTWYDYAGRVVPW